jgi:uncharacterized membrane protein
MPNTNPEGKTDSLTWRGKMKIITSFMVAAILLAALLYVTSGIKPQVTLRIVFGLVYILFLPGFILCWLIFPTNKEIKNVDRIGLSFGLSIPLVLLTVLMADSLLGFQLDSISIIYLIGILIVALLFANLTRYIFRRRVPHKETGSAIKNQ